MKQLKKNYLGVALALSTCAVLFQNCAAAPPPDLSQLSSSSTGAGSYVPVAPVVQPTPVPAVQPPAPTPIVYQSCQLNGQVIPHNGSTTAYLSASVAYGQQCSLETRTCNNGTLSGSATNATCFVQSPAATASCSLDGKTILHGGAITAYATTLVAYGSSCSSVSETRYCTNGTLSGSLPYTNCTAQTAPPVERCIDRCGEEIPCGTSTYYPYKYIDSTYDCR